MSANASPADLSRFSKLRKDLDRIATRSPAQRCLDDHLARVRTGYELQTEPADYHWHGLKRGGDPRHPLVLFQYSIEGTGAFWSKKRGLEQVTAGYAFTGIIPSDHEYYLPPDSEGWRFLWLMISHPCVVSRIRERQRTASPVWFVPAESLLAGIALRIHEAVETGGFANPFDEERLLMEFLVTYDQFGSELEHPSVERSDMLRSVRDAVEENLRHPATIESIAARHGMSRSHFSHRFRRVTGLSPAQFIIQVRLGHVTELLNGTRLKLDAVATETGFANATHLCRVFRQYYHLSPDSFRRQTGPR